MLFFGPEQCSHAFDSRKNQEARYEQYSKTTYSDIIKLLNADYNKNEFSFLFSKDFATYAIDVNNPNYLFNDLLLNPKNIMKEYCNLVGLNYNDNILKWEKGSENQSIEKHFETSIEWHKRVLETNGIISKTENEIKKDNENAIKFAKQSLPNDVLEAIEENIPAYNELYSKRFRIDIN